MSQSFAHEDGIEPRSGASPDGSLDEQLAAEIADHLAAAADDLKQRGEAEDEAARLALARFGDVARVKRQCWRIHNGEEVMFRTAGIALLSLLTIGVAMVGFGGWRLQRNLSARTEELSAQLASLTDTQQAMLAQQRPPEFTGLAYLGDPSRPAKGVEIQVFRFSEVPPTTGSFAQSGLVTRRIRTDAQGRFDSGILQSGEYCLLAPILDPDGQEIATESLFNQLQSRPLFLVVGVEKATVDLNLLASGRLTLEVKSIPNSIRIGDQEVPVFMRISVSSDGMYYLKQRPLPPSDDPPRDGWPLPLPPGTNNLAGGSRRPADLPHSWWLPPRKYKVTLLLGLGSENNVGSGFGPQAAYTKFVELDLDLSPTSTATITLNVIGESLEKRFEVAEDELEKMSEPKLSSGPKLSPGLMDFLKRVAEGVELNAALAMEETAIAR